MKLKRSPLLLVTFVVWIGLLPHFVRAEEPAGRMEVLEATIALEAGDYAWAIESAEAAMKANESAKEPTDEYRMAAVVKLDALIGQGKFKEAQSWARELHRRIPNDPAVAYGRGRLALRIMGQVLMTKDAISNLDELKRFDEAEMELNVAADWMQTKLKRMADAHRLRAKGLFVRIRMLRMQRASVDPAQNEKNDSLRALYQRRITLYIEELTKSMEAAMKAE